MRCKAPYYHPDLGIFCPCGKCLGCFINRRRKWTLRIYLESLCWYDVLFTTLTYSPENLPADGNLVPRHLQLFLKRLRRRLAPARIRFFACGEYGTKSLRPHYHLILFGVSLSHQDIINDCWDYGFTYSKVADKKSMEYVAGYVTKKYRGYDDDVKSGKRVKEFLRCSLRPPIGVPAIPYLIDNAKVQLGGNDVLRVLKIGEKDYPLDRVLKNRLRNFVFSEADEKLIKEVYIETLKNETKELFRSSGIAGLANRSPRQLGEWARWLWNEKYADSLSSKERFFNRLNGRTKI